MRKVQGHYENLKVAADAPSEVIKAAYKVLAQKYHPDRNLANSDAVRVMALVNEAYRVLSNPELRAQYDNWLISVDSGPHCRAEGAAAGRAPTSCAESKSHSRQHRESGPIDLEQSYENFKKSWWPIAIGFAVGFLMLMFMLAIVR